jgi:hypothetical protein
MMVAVHRYSRSVDKFIIVYVLCELIQSASLIIWDEALMTHKIAFEALDRTLRDILSIPSSASKQLPFGGKVVVLGGDLDKLYLS